MFVIFYIIKHADLKCIVDTRIFCSLLLMAIIIASKKKK